MAGRAAALLAAASVALALAGVAAADAWQIRRTPAGNAAARAAVVKRGDLGTTAQWKGGARKPNLSSDPDCGTWHPKQSDLVVVGAAESQWKTPGVEVDSSATVLKTPRMVALDWRRTAIAPQVIPCMRSALAKALGSSGRVVSVGRVPVPKLGTFTMLVRAVLDVPAAGGAHAKVLVDSLLVGRGSTELTLTMTAPYAARAAIKAAELRLARVLASRVRA